MYIQRLDPNRALTVLLTCPVHTLGFPHPLSNDVAWLSEHWHGEFRSACPFCRCDHVYRTKDVFMRAAIHRRDYISDLFSAEV